MINYNILFSIAVFLYFNCCNAQMAFQNQDDDYSYEEEDQYVEDYPYEEDYQYEDSGENNYYYESYDEYGNYQSNDDSEPTQIAPQYGVTPRNYNENLADKYSGKDFDYTEDDPKLNDVIPTKMDGAKIGIVGKVLLYAVLILAALFLLYIILDSLLGINLKDGNFIKKRPTKIISEQIDENPDDIKDNDFVRLAEKAENEGNYRLAFRYMFLNLLQNLNLKSYIEWRKNKTNNDYTKEIKNQEIKREYKELAHEFDYVWYGQTPIANERFYNFKKEFESLNKQL